MHDTGIGDGGGGEFEILDGRSIPICRWRVEDRKGKRGHGSWVNEGKGGMRTELYSPLRRRYKAVEG